MNAKKQTISNKSRQFHTIFYAIIIAAFFLRLMLAAFSKGFESDIACFGSWALRVYEGGFSGFYSPDVFTDYPPGYIYILYGIGAILHGFRMDILSPAGLILLKLPSILADILAGIFIVRISSGRVSDKTALFLCALYLFNPAVLLNSVVWGQIDSILALLVILLCYFLTEKRMVTVSFIFALGILCKPQMLIFTPLLLYGIYEFEILGFSDLRKFLKHALGGILAIISLVLAMLPFGIDKVIPQYTDTLGSYPYVSVNAYNLWAFLGLNWASQEKQVLAISFRTIGTLALVILTILSALLFEALRRKHREERYFLTGAFLIITTFVFSVRMHERYLYPAMLLLMCTYVFGKYKSFFYSYILVSLAHFFNVWHVLYYYNPETYYATLQTIILLSGLTLVSAACFYVAAICSLRHTATDRSLHQMAVDCSMHYTPKIFMKLIGPKEPVCSKASVTFGIPDWAFIAVITLCYNLVAFVNLGYAKAPQTEYSWPAQSTVSLEFEDTDSPAVFCYYLKYEEALSCTLQYSSDGLNWSEPCEVNMQNVFSWGQAVLQEEISYLRLTNESPSGNVGEFIFLNDEGEIVTPTNSSQYTYLFDEWDTLPDTLDYRSSAYFDEIYYFRTAYEFSKGLPAYENTHPPLGKIFIMLGAFLFGMNPFGFRFMGALFGVLMLPFIYLLARNLIGNRIISAMATLCFAFDFMHFTQTRIATIDVFVVFFILLMYFFMERYLRLSFYDTPLKKTFLPLGACGIAFGLGISCKWTGFYAGAGLAILFFASLYKRYLEYRYACINPRKESNGISHQHIIASFPASVWKTIAFCVLFFILIPAAIYSLSYIPFRDYTDAGLWTRMWNNQQTMFHYHSTLNATHPYSSPWYEWPTMVRPVFYYFKDLGNDLYQGISAFGNPLVWYMAIPAGIYTLYLAFAKQKPTALFLSVGFLTQLLPWTLVTRCTFLYHYFPCVPFLVLMIGYSASLLQKRIPQKRFYLLCLFYVLATALLFAMFYPVISGFPVSGKYVDTFLRWFDSWVLIIN